MQQILCREFLRLAARRARIADETHNREQAAEMRRVIRRHWHNRNQLITVGRVA